MNDLDCIEKLKIEVDGFQNNINQYTHNATVTNYFYQLKNSLNNNSINRVLYCLHEIRKWYSMELSKISTNPFVTDTEIHRRNYELICQICEQLEENKNQMDEKYQNTNSSNHSNLNSLPIIFLSHKSDDKKYADALRDFIIGLGVKNNELIYTSHPLHKIPLDANIYDYLRESFGRKIFVIILWSDKYLESPACLNEMGAAWVTQSDYTNIYVPNFSFGNPKYHECAIDTRKMGAVLNGDSNCKTSMIELKNKIQSFFNLENNEANSSYLLDNFMRTITEDPNNEQT